MLQKNMKQFLQRYVQNDHSDVEYYPAKISESFDDCSFDIEKEVVLSLDHQEHNTKVRQAFKKVSEA